jgi:DNA recombination protein RmuC
MEPLIYLLMLVLGILGGAILSMALTKGSRTPSLAASEAEIAEFKARIEEREKTIELLRSELDAERNRLIELNEQHRAAAAAQAAAETLSNERAAQVARLEDTLRDKETALAIAQSEVSALHARHASLLTRLDEAEKAQAEKLKAIEEAQARMAETFKGVAAEALTANNQNFLTLAETAFQKAQESAKGDLDVRSKAIEESLKPLKEAVDRMEKDRVDSFAGLREQVHLLNQAQTKIEAETSKLVNALRSPAVRGRWGEIQLRRVVEMAGMVDHCDFEEQVAVETENGRLRPDMIVRLPNHREIVVDAKVSLSAYLDSIDLTDEGERRSKLAEHAGQVRAHIQRLAAKNYWDQFEKAPDFVVAFLPGEAFFSAALSQDPELIEYGVSNRVLLATPTTLIALLKAVAFGWRQERLAENAQQISDLGKELYDRLLTMTSNFDDLRRGLERAVDSYNRTVGGYESRVLVSARRFKDLSATTAEEIEAPEPIDKAVRQVASTELALLATATVSANGEPAATAAAQISS